MEDLSVNSVVLVESTNSPVSDSSLNFLFALLTSKISDSKFIQDIKLDENSIKVINLVLNKCPSVIEGLSSHIKTIISDNVINSSDIPTVILLLRDVLNTHVSELNRIKVTREQVIVLIKNIFTILIEDGVIKTGSPESKQATLALVDLCVKLLESKVNVQKVIKCRFF
jgi:hypothetical protein